MWKDRKSSGESAVLEKANRSQGVGHFHCLPHQLNTVYKSSMGWGGEQRLAGPWMPMPTDLNKHREPDARENKSVPC